MTDSTLTPEQIAEVEAKRKRDAENAVAMTLQPVMNRVLADMKRRKKPFADLTDKAVYTVHSRLLMYIANNICLAGQRRQYVVDEHNKDVLRFLLYLFQRLRPMRECISWQASQSQQEYTSHGRCRHRQNADDADILRVSALYEQSEFLSQSIGYAMVNYYTIHNNLDRYTFNEENSTGFMPQPMNVCLNDIGIESKLFFGMDTKQLTNEFIHARNEIWTMTAPDQRKFGHLTTNLDKKQLEEEFADQFGRLKDRFKTYNILTLTGESRR